MHPLNHVVADVHGVGVFGQQLHLERVAVAGRLEGLVPPRGPFQQGRAHGLGRPPVEVVHQRRHGLTDGRRGVLFAQAVAYQLALHDGLVDGRGVVEELVGVIAGPGVEGAGLVGGIGQLNEGMVQVHGQGAGVGRHGADFAALGPAHQRHDGLKLRVEREALGIGQKHRRAAFLGLVAALLKLLQLVAELVGVAQQKGREVYQHPVALPGFGLEPPDDGLGKGLLHRFTLVGVGAPGAVVVVGLEQQDFGAAAHEFHDARLPNLAPVEAQVVGAHAVGQAAHVENFLVELVDFEQNPPALLVPVKREKALELLQALGFFGQGLGLEAGGRKQQQAQQQEVEFGHAQAG